MDVEKDPEKLNNTEAAIDNITIYTWHLPYPGLQPVLHLPVPAALL